MNYEFLSIWLQILIWITSNVKTAKNLISIVYFRYMILVTGGTGLVGSHLLYFLLKENEKVRAIHRSNSDLSAVKKVFSIYTKQPDEVFNKIEWVEANIIDIPALTEAFKDISIVYHCAAYISFDPANYKKLKKANIEGTANIVNLSLAFNIKKLCYVSSIATLGSSLNGEAINEESSWNPDEDNSVYAITKYGAEMEIWRGSQENLNVVIVNPGVILGTSPDGDGSGLILNLAAKGIPFYPSGEIGIVDVQDVVKAMILLMHSEIKNQQFILVSQNVSYKELLSKLANYFNKKAPNKALPKWILNIGSSLDWFSSKLLGTKRILVQATVNSMYTKSNYESSKIKNELGFEFIPVNETLDRVAKTHLLQLNNK